MIKRFFATSGKDWAAFFEAVFLMLRMRLQLRLQGMSAPLDYATRQPAKPEPPDPAVGRSVARALRRGKAYLPFQVSCLEQALVGAVMLGRRGQSAFIEVGMDRDANGKVLGHAWLHAAGQVICGGEQPHSAFTSIARFPKT